MDKRPEAIRRGGGAQGAVVVLASVLPVMAVTLISPIVPMLRETFAHEPGAEFLTTATLTAPGLAVALCSPFIGVLIDRSGYRKVLLSALVVYGLLGILPLWLNGLSALLAARLVLGVAEAAIMTAVFGLVAAYFDGAERARWIAYKSSAGAVGAIGFYVLGGALGELGWRAPFAAYGASLLVAVVAFAVIFEPKREVAPTAPPPPDGRGSLTTFLTICAVTVSCAMLFYIIPLQFGVRLSAAGVTSPGQIGLLIALAGAGAPIGALSFRFVSRIPTPPIIGGAASVAALGLALASAAGPAPVIVLGGFINQIGCGLLGPTMVAASLHVLPPNRRGVGGGAWVTSFFLGQFLSPILVAGVIAATGSDIRQGFLVLGGVTLGFGIVATFGLRLVMPPAKHPAVPPMAPSGPVAMEQ